MNTVPRPTGEEATGRLKSKLLQEALNKMPQGTRKANTSPDRDVDTDPKPNAN